MPQSNKFWYKKTYTRENCLVAFQLWEDHQTKAIVNFLNWSAPATIYNVTEAVGEVYFREDAFIDYEKILEGKIKKDKNYVRDYMQWYQDILAPLEIIWNAKNPLKNKAELIEFYHHVAKAWCGLDVSYFVPGIKSASQKDKDTAMHMRERAAAFLEDTDKIIELTLKKMYPKLGELIKYLSIQEVRNDEMPLLKILKDRKKHFIYFRDVIHTNVSFEDFIEREGLKVQIEKIKVTDTLKGQVAMKGLVKGRVRLVVKKENLKEIQLGEILITTMTTPDYLPAMHKAAAFITDEGGITCHAAIVARELGKPCVIGTKFATQIFKTGDMVEVDANNGIIKLI